MMSEMHDPMEEEKTYPIRQSAAFAGTTLVTMGLIDLLAHLGPTGLLVSGLASYVAWKHGPELYEQVREMLPSPAPSEQEDQDEQPRPKGRSFLERALGYFPDGDDEAQQEEREGQQSQRHAVSPDCVYLGAQLTPHADLVLSNRFAILGMPNAGKSNTIAVLVEELGRLGVPLVLFDQKPEYERLCTRPYLAKPYHATARNLTSQNARAFGQQIMREQLQVVLDLPSYQDDDEAAHVMIELVTGIWLWEHALPNEERLPCMLILDEADYWLPQSEQHAHVDRTRKDGKGRTLFVRLQNTLFNVVHRGRSLGLGIIVSSQRPANIDNRAIAVAEWKILLKANMPHDLAVYKRFGVAAEVAMHLARGEAYVLGPQEITGVFQLRKRTSPDDAQTPGLHQLQRAAGQATMAGWDEQRSVREPWEASDSPIARELSLEKLIALLEAGKINERTLVTLIKQLPVVSAEPDEEFDEEEETEQYAARPVKSVSEQQHKQEQEPTLLERALVAWDEGARSGPKMAAALHITLWEVRPLMEMVKREVAKREQDAK